MTAQRSSLRAPAPPRKLSCISAPQPAPEGAGAALQVSGSGVARHQARQPVPRRWSFVPPAVAWAYCEVSLINPSISSRRARISSRAVLSPMANWPELLKAVALEVLGANPQSPGYDMQEPERKLGGDRQSIWSIPKSEQATSSASSSAADLFRRTGLSRLPRDPGAENRGERNGHQEHHRPHGRHRRGRGVDG